MAPILKKCVSDLKEPELKGKRVLVRFHPDVRLDENLIMIGDSIKVLSTVVVNIKYLIAHDAKVILCGHLGRPEGFNSKYSLKPIAGKLSEILGVEVKMAKDCIGEEVEKLVAEIADGGVLLLENLSSTRRKKRMTLNLFRMTLMEVSSLADVFVNEAFGIAYRAYASTVGVTKYLKPSVGGFVMHGVVPADRIPDGSMVVCIGPDTIKAFKEACGTAKTIIWNGPIGIKSEFDKNGPIHILEFDKFSPTDDVISNVLADLSAKGVTTIIGGDNTIAAVENVGVAKQMSHISTGFHPGLEILTGKQLPAVSALDDDYTTILSKFSQLFTEMSGCVANQMSHISTGFHAGLEILTGKQLPAVSALDDDYITVLSKFSQLFTEMSGCVANQMSHISTGFGTGLEILAGEQLHAVLSALDDDYTPIPLEFSKLFTEMSGWVDNQMSHISTGFGTGLEILAGVQLHAVLSALDDDYTPIPFKFTKLLAEISGWFAAANGA